PPYKAPPENFDTVFALAVLGYDVRDPLRAISAFKLHFAPDRGIEMDETDRGMLYCLVEKVTITGRE
ncbi:MAG: hypothetical protein LBV49_10390, partial [Azonexus sp.]|nr:hypothetical protein [Azonexus sp.]